MGIDHRDRARGPGLASNVRAVARYERETTRPVLAGDAAGNRPDPNVVVARVGPDGKIKLGRLDLAPSIPDEPTEPADDADPAEGLD